MVIEATARPIDEAKLGAFLSMFVTDLGATLSSALVVIGDKLGLYRAMADGEPVTSVELSERTGTSERYVREWLINQAAGGYIDYDTATGAYSLPYEHAVALTDEDGPIFVAGGYQLATSLIKSEPRITEAFRTGHGVHWGEHDHGFFHGTERFFRPGYVANIVANWIPALEGIDDKLRFGGKVADVGCGHGASTIIMAQAYPLSRVYGFDIHAPSIERAREAAHQAGLADRVTFEVAAADELPGANYDLLTYFDCLHDMGDPAAAMRRAAAALAPGGSAMIVEPMAGDRVEDNLNPVGRIFAAASVLVCTPNAVAQGGAALGTVASDQALRDVVKAGGFATFRRATETPFNRIFEARV